MKTKNKTPELSKLRKYWNITDEEYKQFKAGKLILGFNSDINFNPSININNKGVYTSADYGMYHDRDLRRYHKTPDDIRTYLHNIQWSFYMQQHDWFKRKSDKVPTPFDRATKILIDIGVLSKNLTKKQKEDALTDNILNNVRDSIKQKIKDGEQHYKLLHTPKNYKLCVWNIMWDCSPRSVSKMSNRCKFKKHLMTEIAKIRNEMIGEPTNDLEIYALPNIQRKRNIKIDEVLN